MPAILYQAIDSLYLVIPPPKDQYTNIIRDDLQFTKVWCSTVNGFTPANENLVYQGPNLAITIPNLTAGITYYVKYALISELITETEVNNNVALGVAGTSDDAYVISDQLSQVPLTSTGAVLTITGGTRAYVYNAAGDAVEPTNSGTFAVTLQKGDSFVTPTSYSWTGTSRLAGTSTSSTFSPSVSTTYSVSAATTISVTVVHEGVSISETIPILISKVGDTGAAGATGAPGAPGAGTYTLNFVTAAYGSDRSTVINTRQFAGWDSQAYSTQGYVDSVYCSAKSTALGNFAIFGLRSGGITDTVATGSDISYGWYLEGGSNAILIHENGSPLGTLYGTYTLDSVFSIVYDGSSVKYYLDGVIKRTVARALGAALYFDSSFYTPGQGIKDLVFGPGGGAGTPGATGATGAQAVTAYKIEISTNLPAAPTSASAGWPTTSGYGSWTTTPPIALTANEWLFQVSGTYDGTTYTWTSPAFLATFKVGALSALSANLGTITAGSIAVGSTPAISGTTMTGSGAVINTNGTFAVGSSTNNITYSGSDNIYINGTVQTDNFKLNSINGSMSINSGVESGGIRTDMVYAINTQANGRAAFFKATGNTTNGTYPVVGVGGQFSGTGYGAAGYFSRIGAATDGYGVVATGDNSGALLAVGSGTAPAISISNTAASGKGLYVESTGTGSSAAQFINTNSSKQVYLGGGLNSVYVPTGGGSVKFEDGIAYVQSGTTSISGGTSATITHGLGRIPLATFAFTGGQAASIGTVTTTTINFVSGVDGTVTYYLY